MKVSYQLVSESLRIGIALFGAWSLWAQTASLLGASFSSLKAFSLVPIIGGFLLLRPRGESEEILQPDPTTPPRTSDFFGKLPRWTWILAPFVIVGLFEIIKSEWLFWVLSIVYLFAILLAYNTQPSTSQKPPNPSFHGKELFGVTCICIVAVLLTLGSHRPDPDDAFFLSLTSSAIDYPNESLYGFDSLYRSGLPLVAQHLHFVQTYEYFVAVLADSTGISVHTLYYVTLPAICSFLGILVNWVFLRRFLPRVPALIGLIALVGLLAAWGDGHRTLGNFSFVRMFEGKAVYLLVALPMIVHSALQYHETPSRRNWLFLMLHQVAAMGFTTNGLVVAPMASAFALLAMTGLTRNSLTTLAKGVATSFPIIIFGIGMMFKLNQYDSAGETDPLHLGYQTVLGTERTGVTLLGLLLLPALAQFAKVRNAGWIAKYIFITVAILLCPAISKFFGINLAAVFSWRILWSWPVPLLLAFLVGMVFCKALRFPLLKYLLLGVGIASFTLRGPFSITSENWAWANIGKYKVNSHFQTTERLNSLIPEDNLSLVPQNLAINLCGLQKCPPLVAVRLLYLDILEGALPKEDLRERFHLIRYVGGIIEEDLGVDWLMNKIESRGIQTIVFTSTHDHADSLVHSLMETGFEVTNLDNHVVAVKSAQ